MGPKGIMSLSRVDASGAKTFFSLQNYSPDGNIILYGNIISLPEKRLPGTAGIFLHQIAESKSNRWDHEICQGNIRRIIPKRHFYGTLDEDQKIQEDTYEEPCHADNDAFLLEIAL
jgi:hypothetical protein